ncbi:hypothetical protein [Parachlamydia sp. AcF125]|uniref:hypothetical protein n=1 Tax=Parachlamydia sp. AcF125 TaxID=2795736 RepID=UPI001BCA4396|nr:hypothetical protein [Parachlamydia sp. AcF125]MBS4168670.1 hypothetical protein [Parachlamydia sp. AcF125]
MEDTAASSAPIYFYEFETQQFEGAQNFLTQANPKDIRIEFDSKKAPLPINSYYIYWETGCFLAKTCILCFKI